MTPRALAKSADRDSLEIRELRSIMTVHLPIGLADPMIDAIALVTGLDLVTGNTRHFQRIQQVGYPLALVNWR